MTADPAGARLLPSTRRRLKRLERERCVNARRQLVLDAIRAHPGISLRALARATGLRSSTLTGQVAHLVREGVVHYRREDGRLAHYAGAAAVRLRSEADPPR